MRMLLLFFIFISSMCCDAKMLFYRIPFRIQTYNPITRGEIRKLSIENGMQELSPPNIKNLLLLLESKGDKSSLFDDENIRMYIVEGNHDEYFIDNKGVVVSEKKKYKYSKIIINEDEVIK